ncbi:hypothetical protein [Mumia zhuanghuii]|uniref:Uncharacterized protein n=1 Tax=Mumia zhuanghuii TaxID=2585211 RepID=A0A5C4MEV4_9ACTN|nr:hypothetical protein [Mumia zhuanghuii]TNC33515.1 hypothetical protein FHE65_28920 [Mumia zhuanghuii]
MAVVALHEDAEELQAVRVDPVRLPRVERQERVDPLAELDEERATEAQLGHVDLLQLVQPRVGGVRAELDDDLHERRGLAGGEQAWACLLRTKPTLEVRAQHATLAEPLLEERVLPGHAQAAQLLQPWLELPRCVVARSLERQPPEWGLRPWTLRVAGLRVGQLARVGQLQLAPELARVE